ncbi:hypothetical protein CPB83DRAFT_864629 [Crepidotus variabilis]|uniref:F-box domain-containing protein n=1 Tax=Crepidotus variabilis TaxID=179855 RepID=A0A9P6JIT0_9AGAR|nr:hypothetical protein CPB83DRAFT_864629 [Crepidotus variabilis]
MANTKSRLPKDISEKCVKHRNGTCTACQKLANLDRKIDDARQALERLQAERESFASVLNQTHDPFAQRLPRELVSRVFLHCQPILPPFSDIPSDKEKSFLKAVLGLGHICQNWRKITESTPDIWATSRFTITNSNCIQSVAMIRQWLQRSGALRLHFELKEAGGLIEVGKRAALKIVSSIIAHSSRMQEIRLSSSYILFPPLLAAFRANRFQYLDRLILQCDESGFTPELEIETAPRWIVLCRQVYVEVDATDWAQVTHVEVGYLLISDIIHLIQHAPILSFFKVETVQYNISPSSTTLVVSPFLQSLSVGQVNSSFWNHFTFPCLDTLHITFHQHNDPGWTPLQNLLRRSGCAIKELYLAQNHWFAQEGLVDVMRLTPSLQNLGLTFETDVDEGSLFTALDTAAAQSEDINQPTPEILRNLKTLTCTSKTDVFPWSDFIGFLATMTSRPEKSLQLVDLKPRHRGSDDLEDKVMYKNLMDAAGGVELRVIAADSQFDMLDFYRRRSS